MAFIVPLIAIFGGGSAFIWGVNKIINEDDSADAAMKNFFEQLPVWVQNNIQSFDYKKGEKLSINFVNGLSKEMQEETLQAIKKQGSDFLAKTQEKQ